MMKGISKIAHRKPALLAFAVALGCAQSALADSVYVQHNLVSNGAANVTADHVDSNLQNAWGITFAPGSPMWVANNGTSTSTIYNGSGTAASLIVAVTGMDPTGIVWNGSSSFNIARRRRHVHLGHRERHARCVGGGPARRSCRPSTAPCSRASR
jgi:hypothetical protein